MMLCDHILAGHGDRGRLLFDVEGGCGKGWDGGGVVRGGGGEGGWRVY